MEQYDLNCKPSRTNQVSTQQFAIPLTKKFTQTKTKNTISENKTNQILTKSVQFS
jgi:hypothetical protein